MKTCVMNKTCKNASCEIRRALERSLGQFLLHSEIRVDRPELYRDDGVHLSEVGLDIFLQDLQQGLWEGLGLPVGARA